MEQPGFSFGDSIQDIYSDALLSPQDYCKLIGKTCSEDKYEQEKTLSLLNRLRKFYEEGSNTIRFRNDGEMTLWDIEEYWNPLITKETKQDWFEKRYLRKPHYTDGQPIEVDDYIYSYVDGRVIRVDALTYDDDCWNIYGRSGKNDVYWELPECYEFKKVKENDIND
jgi:hypothetical protein